MKKIDNIKFSWRRNLDTRKVIEKVIINESYPEIPKNLIIDLTIKAKVSISPNFTAHYNVVHFGRLNEILIILDHYDFYTDHLERVKNSFYGFDVEKFVF